jgi:hypothetical protein
MSDSYEIDGVTVTPLGGGFYELKHASITAEGGIEKVRGKEAAEARAAEIAKAATPPDGHMEGQAPLSDEAIAAAAAAPPSDTEARIAGMEDTINKMAKFMEGLATAGVTTVVAEAPSTEGQVPAGIPTRFEGELSKEAKKALKNAGLGYTKIILEENSDIPPTGLFVGHNGRGYMIQPGTPVDVPDFVLGVLNDAKMSAPVTDSKSLKVLGYRERMKYPYRLVD